MKTHTNTAITSTMASTTTITIPQHFLIGAMSGGIYSLSLSCWENIGLFITSKRILPQPSSSSPVITASPSPFRYTFMTNTITHSILYGSYEGIKRFLWNNTFHHTNHLRSMQQQSYHNDDTVTSETFTTIPIFGIAGGTAGVLHHIVSHLIEQ